MADDPTGWSTPSDVADGAALVGGAASWLVVAVAVVALPAGPATTRVAVPSPLFDEVEQLTPTVAARRLGPLRRRPVAIGRTPRTDWWAQTFGPVARRRVHAAR